MIPPEARLLRVYLNAHDRWHHQPLYQAVVEKARAMDLAGASVFRVELGYGANHQLRDAGGRFQVPDADRLPIRIGLGPGHRAEGRLEHRPETATVRPEGPQEIRLRFQLLDAGRVAGEASDEIVTDEEHVAVLPMLDEPKVGEQKKVVRTPLPRRRPDDRLSDYDDQAERPGVSCPDRDLRIQALP